MKFIKTEGNSEKVSKIKENYMKFSDQKDVKIMNNLQESIKLKHYKTQHEPFLDITHLSTSSKVIKRSISTALPSKSATNSPDKTKNSK